jgi:hypothetical protein
LRFVERAGGGLGGLACSHFSQGLGGEADGFAVVVADGVGSFQHGDQQGGAGRLDGEQDADAAVGGRARPQLKQALGRGLATAGQAPAYYTASCLTSSA